MFFLCFLRIYIADYESLLTSLLLLLEDSGDLHHGSTSPDPSSLEGSKAEHTSRLRLRTPLLSGTKIIFPKPCSQSDLSRRPIIRACCLFEMEAAFYGVFSL
jgi:hypothetical protein